MIQLIRGFKDILPGEVALWQRIESVARSLFEDFGFAEIRPPLLEKTELFKRGIGEETDIVSKEMYTFPDRKGELLTLRPEATASVVRAYIEHKLYAQDPVQKLYTIGPMFRRERPQKGRYRQFYQINAEVFGIASPLIDAQLILILSRFFERLEVKDVSVYINSLGCPECRPAFKERLTGFLAQKRDALCEDCVRRSTHNPLRVLDCKVPSCQAALSGAPSVFDDLCPACREHFDVVQAALTRLDVPFAIDTRLVRGLDYYTRTAFEIKTGSLGAQNAVAGGGRYDGLVSLLGGPPQPAIGFAVGFDRLVEIVSLEPQALVRRPDLFIAALGRESRDRAFEWAAALSLAGIAAEMEFSEKSLKSLMKRANRLGAAHVLIVGEEELAKGEAVLRNMQTKEQVPLPLEGIVAKIREIVGA